LQVYEARWLALYFEPLSDAPRQSQHVLRRCQQLFPDIRSADREQERLGQEQIEQAHQGPSLKMVIEREVILPEKG